jgi:aconitate hydratase
VLVGDSVTTDHISPAGAIDPNSPGGSVPAGARCRGADFNSYGSRRGNDRVMTRGTFANIRMRNQLAAGDRGRLDDAPADRHADEHLRSGDEVPGYGHAAVVFAGKDYGMGSSRDWAAKGTFLLGVRAVIAESFERIHRSNLVGMGVLPLQFADGASVESLGLSGRGTYDIADLGEGLEPSASG